MARLAFDQTSAWILAIILTSGIAILASVYLPKDSLSEEELQAIEKETLEIRGKRTIAPTPPEKEGAGN